MADQQYPPGMHRPEWETVLVDTGQKTRPVGDPTLWANTVTTPIDVAYPVVTPRVIYSEQIVFAAAADRYARNWSLIGNLSVGAGVDMVDPAAAPPNTPTEFGTSLVPLTVWLEIVQGIGMVSIKQLFLLQSGVSIAGGAGNYGLCNNQTSGQGGPYGVSYNLTPPDPLNPDFRASFPFAMIGALIGQTVNVRAVYSRSAVDIGPIPNVSLACLITPYAPGAGI